MGKRTKWLSSTNLKIVGYADNFIVITSTISHHHVSSGGHRRREEAGWWIRKGVGRYRSTNSRVIDWAYVWWWAPNEGRARRNAQWSMLLVEFESLYIVPLIYIDCRRRPSVSKSSTAALSCTTGSFDSAWKFIAVWNLELALCYVPPIIIIVRHLCVLQNPQNPECKKFVWWYLIWHTDIRWSVGAQQQWCNFLTFLATRTWNFRYEEQHTLSECQCWGDNGGTE